MNTMPTFISTLFDMGELTPADVTTKEQAVEVVELLEDRHLRDLMRPVWNRAFALLTGKPTIVVTPETQNHGVTIEVGSLDEALKFLESIESGEPDEPIHTQSSDCATWDEWVEGTYDLLAVRPKLGFDRMSLVMYGSMTAYIVGEHKDEDNETFWVLVTEDLKLVTVQDPPKWAPSLHRDTQALYAKWRPKLEAYRCFLWPEHLRIQGLVTDENFRFDRHEIVPSEEDLQEMEARWRQFDEDIKQPRPEDQEKIDGIFAIALRQQEKRDRAWLEKQPRHDQYAEARRRLMRDVKKYNVRTGVGYVHTVLAQMLGKPPIVVYKAGRKLSPAEQKQENSGRYYGDPFIEGCRPWRWGSPVRSTKTPPAPQPKRFTTRQDCPRPTAKPEPATTSTTPVRHHLAAPRRIDSKMVFYDPEEDKNFLFTMHFWTEEGIRLTTPYVGRRFYPDCDFEDGTTIQTSAVYLDKTEKLILGALNGTMAKLRAQKRRWAAEEAIEKLAAEEVHTILKPQEMARMAC